MKWQVHQHQNCFESHYSVNALFAFNQEALLNKMYCEKAQSQASNVQFSTLVASLFIRLLHKHVLPVYHPSTVSSNTTFNSNFKGQDHSQCITKES